MNIQELLKRKYRRGWSDVQFLVMLELGRHGRVSFMDMVISTGASIGGIGNTLSRQPVVEYVERVSHKGRWCYALNKEGKRALAEMLAPMTGKPVVKKPAPPSGNLRFRRVASRVHARSPVRGFLC